ncbi:LytR/AlgR family response regulator transcription factor [Mucilaginibacter myungsuensis]|uniref:Response regulator transcription factor n=1 Tax=Mucilaginibacter myungsuensis TaxID=649104 RepID=A0A929KTZ8_9SPHI|nr:LytTR family DNA-binding domain-containing protein [Mucilaginibacter myungsuensis]MBE9661152.1 response regulator transcription factor [Mucilaginibacter myungsuensis]MDN3597297.1 LytTR family DNA-binding domain-containing protein [Mucilaginibacter myungsuensis]
MIKAIAVDDEPLALEVIRSHAGRVPFLQMAGYFTNAFEAIDFMARERMDLLFLDIKMPDISGIELMEGLQQKPMVIFTTAYAEHAVTSYELNATDYLLKPFSYPRFLKACHKAHEQLQLKQGNKPAVADSVFVKTGYEQVKIMFDELLYLEGGGNYMSFVMADGRTILSRLTMTDALALLPAELFARVHRSYIINKSKVDKIERHQLHLGGQTVPVGSAFDAVNILK